MPEGVFLTMKNQIFYTVLLAVAGLGRCLGQVPDSLLKTPQVPVFQQDTLPKDSLLVATDTSTASPALSPTDSVAPKKRGFFYRTFKSDYPNPNKALYLSLAFPGGGQIYNKRWWKPPIIWGGYVALIYSVQYNTSRYRRLQDAYLAELHHQPQEFSGIYDAGDLKLLRDQFDKNKQLSYIGLFALHLVQSAEAFVDCHLKTFDVSDDLSLRLKPSLEPTPFSAPALGFGVAFSVR
ncbi:MAG: hypothetical protein HY842_19395 [Bacteroidetes bacterium]|nr:hypothetical protein [Bacteroidota bacterium]